MDESGAETLFRDEQFLAVAALSTDNLREIELAVKHTRKRYGSNQPSGELNAHKAPEKAIRYLLGAIADASAEIVEEVIHQELW